MAHGGGIIAGGINGVLSNKIVAVVLAIGVNERREECCALQKWNSRKSYGLKYGLTPGVFEVHTCSCTYKGAPTKARPDSGRRQTKIQQYCFVIRYFFLARVRSNRTNNTWEYKVFGGGIFVKIQQQMKVLHFILGKCQNQVYLIRCYRIRYIVIPTKNAPLERCFVHEKIR